MKGMYRMQGVDIDPPTWAGYAAQLLGAGGLGFLLRELVKRWFQRRDQDDIVAAGLRAEMVRRLEALEKQLGAVELREREIFRRSVKLEAENVHLRRRYHDLINWIAQQPGLPTPPQWLYERIEGPTSGSSMPKPPEPKP